MMGKKEDQGRAAGESLQREGAFCKNRVHSSDPQFSSLEGKEGSGPKVGVAPKDRNIY